jgi:hypothetical protein
VEAEPPKEAHRSVSQISQDRSICKIPGFNRGFFKSTLDTLLYVISFNQPIDFS